MIKELFLCEGTLFAAGTLFSLLLTPLFIRLSLRINIVDRPAAQSHKSHGRATPLLGGSAMLVAWIATGIIAFVAVLYLKDIHGGIFTETIEAVMIRKTQIAGIVAAAVFSVLFGLYDDIRPLSALPKIGGQFIIACLLVFWGGMRITLFIDNEIFQYVISILWFLVLMNAINFFDNMDGLAIGTVTIALIFFAITAALNAQYLVGAFSALSCGVGAGFWYYNKFPARIFMGDSGSHFLAVLAGVASCSTTYFDAARGQVYIAVLIPFFILAVPIFDSIVVVVWRTLHGQYFWIGDNNHISHRFVRMGLSRRNAVRVIHWLCIIIALSVLPLLWGDIRTAAVLVVQTILILGLMIFLQWMKSDDKNDGLGKT